MTPRTLVPALLYPAIILAMVLAVAWLFASRPACTPVPMKEFYHGAA